MGIVTFRYAPPRRSAAETDALNRRLVDKLIEDRFALITSTELRGQTVLRMCTINPRTSPHDIDETLRRLAAFAEQLNAAP